jgi:3alpha(or 20beta)-hydroxysteroid dehydrogenase
VHETAAAISAGARGYVHDVSEESRWQEIVGAVVAEHGHIDVLVNNAGVLLFKTLVDTTVAEFRKVQDVNCLGSFIGMRTVAPHMIARRAGSIVNISSVDGLQGANGLTAYAASKFAVRGMTKVAALELGPLGVRVNSIHPGGINTAMGNRGNQPLAAVNKGYRQFPAQRIGDPLEVANACVYFASDESSYCMGAELTVDGGLSAGHYYWGAPGSPAGMLPPMPAKE